MRPRSRCTNPPIIHATITNSVVIKTVVRISFFFLVVAGEFLASLQRHSEAAVQYVRAAELSPEDYELVVAAATALRQAERRQDAEHWYRIAVHLRPTVSFFY